MQFGLVMANISQYLAAVLLSFEGTDRIHRNFDGIEEIF